MISLVSESRLSVGPSDLKKETPYMGLGKWEKLLQRKDYGEFTRTEIEKCHGPPAVMNKHSLGVFSDP